MNSLAAILFREAPKTFFSALAGDNALFYVDALDALERAFSQRGPLPRPEALEIISESLAAHPEFRVAAEASFTIDPNNQSVTILRRLIEIGWLSEPPRTDWQRVVHVQPNAEILIAALRQMTVGETTQFTDKLQIACSQLLNPDAFQDHAYADLEACLENVRQGLRELHQMESGIDRHTRRLIIATTLKENLEVLYDEFSATIGHACYRELVRAQLPTRILRARRRLDELAEDERTLHFLQREHLHRSPAVEPSLAAAHVRNKLDDLARMLDSVIPQADAIDKRAAEFARRAFARVRYLQEISTGRRESVQVLFESVDANVGGVRLNEIPDSIWLPALRISEVGILSGDALRNPPLRRQAGEIEPIGDELSDLDREEAWRKVQDNLRDNLNVLRANRFVLNLGGESGAEFPIESLGLRNDDDIADLVACLLQASARDASFVVATQRSTDDVAEPQHYRAAGYMIEDLKIIKK